ncbi:hypothetical protein SKAU_G00165930 [Synaphobranchus kaupii]|uniref:Uncharacterized protein n=1 Tax=Synaphobranchus kaupii TaxID=118154 RepID=A0A9Q1FJF0_SYNKA|nr:hypothetical protein SKAU_G00165930 [Synaphobranchus kaupii]
MLSRDPSEDDCRTSAVETCQGSVSGWLSIPLRSPPLLHVKHGLVRIEFLTARLSQGVHLRGRSTAPQLGSSKGIHSMCIATHKQCCTSLLCTPLVRMP